MGSFSAPHHRETGWFERLASKTASLSGKPATFVLATLVVVVWGVTGPIFQYSDTWQLVINTGTTIGNFFDGLSHSEYTNPRHNCSSTEARRANPCDP